MYPARHVQFTSKGLFAAEKVFGGHAVQIVAALDEYVLTPHDEQVAEPVADLNVPASQAAHCSPSTPVYPTRHLHDVRVVLLAAEKVLTGHAMHTSAPENEYVFTPQAVQTVAPTAALYVPARHGSHVIAPSAAPYVPTAQFSHVFTDVAPTAALRIT